MVVLSDNPASIPFDHFGSRGADLGCNWQIDSVLDLLEQDDSQQYCSTAQRMSSGPGICAGPHCISQSIVGLRIWGQFCHSTELG